ncbi:hypothetical protein [Streptomyces sp. NPDC047525]|uniref:hypothetical protein n=1 Tax=Streptomyces sp. NPDC047525 TaxID=3155264 RepID=UPI003409C238
MPWYIKAVLYVAIPAAVLAALYMSIPGEIALAKTAGWSDRYAPAMPVCLSVYALAAGAISWYRRKMELPGQRTALLGGALALGLAMSAQSISHLIQQSYMTSSAALLVAVSCVPPLTIAHLVHMAETPSQVKSASEEMEELRQMNGSLMVALVASESRALLSQARWTLAGIGTSLGKVEYLTGWAEEEAAALDGELNEAERALTARPRRKALELTQEKIEQTRESLAADGKTPTVERICNVLGISQATYYRYRTPVTA